jgi:hypothetical protein
MTQQIDTSVWEDFQVEGECPALLGVKRALLDPRVTAFSFCRYRPDMVTKLTTNLYDASEEISIPVEEYPVVLNGFPYMVRRLAFEDWKVTSPAYRLEA